MAQGEVKQVTGYETTDGKLWVSKEEADTQQKLINRKAAIAELVDDFFYSHISEEHVVDALLSRFDQLAAIVKDHK